MIHFRTGAGFRLSKDMLSPGKKYEHQKANIWQKVSQSCREQEEGIWVGKSGGENESQIAEIPKGNSE